MNFVINQPVGLEESLTCELKEVKSQPVQAIGKVVDQYIVAFLNEAGGSVYWGIRDSDRVVTGVPASQKVRDEIRQVIGQKVSATAPSLPATLAQAPFHPICDSYGATLDDVFVLQVRVAVPQGQNLYLTGGGEAYRKTIGGIRKLSGAELFTALGKPLQSKTSKTPSASLLARLPTVYRRAMLVRPIIHGRRVLWVDDQPSNTFYERLALAEIGVTVDVAISSAEGLDAVRHLRPDVIVSDMNRNGQRDAGLELLNTLRAESITTPVVYYVGWVDEARGVPLGAFGITDRPDEVLHLILDALEREAC